MRSAGRDRVITPNPFRWGVCARCDRVETRRAWKTETELDWAVVRLPRAQRAELKPRIDHHRLREGGFLDGRVTARRWIQDGHRRAVQEGEREQRRGENILAHEKPSGRIIQRAAW